MDPLSDKKVSATNSDCASEETPTLSEDGNSDSGKSREETFQRHRLQPDKPGDTVGNYTLVRILGEGGFGTVFEASQTSPIKRRLP